MMRWPRRKGWLVFALLVPFVAAAVGIAFGLAHPRGGAGAAARQTTAPANTPPGMVWVPGGQFSMGTDDPTAMPNEHPAHPVRVDGFWMDAHDVTNAQFRRFVEATGYLTTAERKPDWQQIRKQLPPGTPKPDDSVLVPGALVFTPTDHPVDLRDLSQWWRWVPGASWRHPLGPDSDLRGHDDDPVVQVSWDDATAYARSAGKRLPTEAEWEFAAWGGHFGTRFYWGNELRPGGKFMCNTYQGTFPVRDAGEDGFAGISPVKSFPPNGYGLYDMAGNVWQWCNDWYRADAHELTVAQNHGCCANPPGPANSLDPNEPYTPKRLVKGGSFLCSVEYCESYRPSARRGEPPDTGTNHLGFRCVMSAADLKPSEASRHE